jgi:hypothetical protein
MKNKKYHNVGTAPKSNRKTKNTTFFVVLLDFGAVPTLWYFLFFC